MSAEILEDLNKTHLSDKGGKHPYLKKYYSKVFGPIRNQSLHIMEVGIYHGASLKLWKDYFPKSTLYGVDIKNRKTFFENLDRLNLFVGRSDSASTYKNVTGQFDIIIDDGNHRAKTQIPTFEILWPKLKNKGLYIIEDIVDLKELENYFKAKNLSYKVFDYSKTHQSDSIIIELKK